MLFIILFIVILLIVIGIFDDNIPITVIVFSFLGFVAYWAIIASLYVTGAFVVENPEVVVKQNIVSLSDESGSEGQFFLGTGYIKEERYFFYTKQEEDYFTIEQLPANGVKIFEDTTDDTAYIKEIHNSSYLSISWLLILSLPAPEVPIYEVHVPEGTIIKQYTIGASR